MLVQSLSIVIPCLNESATLTSCIISAQLFLKKSAIPGEIIVVDNGSIDNSEAIAVNAGAKVIGVKERGYGIALHHGIMCSGGEYVIFADGDNSYHFSEAGVFIEAFEKGFEVVIGNRYKGGIAKQAMPLLHRYLGTPVISFLGKKSFHVQLGDFNCGMRGIKKSTYLKLNMNAEGMEYATEFIARASYNKSLITEVPVKLYRDGRKRKPHLKTWTDGWKHLKLILLLSPKWLLLYPAFFFLIAGLVLGVSLLFNQIRIFNIVLDIHTLYFCSVFLILSLTFFEFYYLVNYYSMSLHIFPQKKITRWISEKLNLEKGLMIGFMLFISGVAVNVIALFRWYKVSFRQLNPQEIFRIIIPGGFLMIAGLQLVVFSFFIAIIKKNLK